MARKMGLSQIAIVRIRRPFERQPHPLENFKFSTGPQFVEKVWDLAGLYLNPPDRAILICVDEKPLLSLAPGVQARQSHDYERHGSSPRRRTW